MPPEQVTDANVFKPQIAIDCNGNAVAVWWQTSPSQLGIYSSQLLHGQTDWSATQTITDANASSPQIAMDCNGNAIAVWEQLSPEEGIYSSQLLHGQTNWGATQTITTETGQSPQIAIDCNGNAIAVWWKEGPSPFDYVIYSSQLLNDKTKWEAPKQIATGGPSAVYNVQIAIACNDNAIVVWEQGSPNDGLYSSQLLHDQTDWSATQTITTAIQDEFTPPRIAIDCNGNAIAVWAQDFPNYGIYSSQLLHDQTNWGATQTITAQAAISPQIAIDCNGNAIAVWKQKDLPQRIYSSQLLHGQTDWSATQTITDPNAFNPQIAMDCNGNTIAVWEQLSPEEGIYSSQLLHGQTDWSATQTITDANAFNPQIAMDCNGNAVVVWSQISPSPDGIYSAKNLVPIAPHVSAHQEFHRFPTQADLINVLTWDPIAYLNPIVKYKVYCTPYTPQKPCCANCCTCLIRCCTCPCTDAQLIGEVSASSRLIFCHHNRCCGQRLTYCVTAVDNQGEETAVPASVTVPPVS